MDLKKIIGIILQIPMYILVVGSLLVSFYAAYNNLQGVTWATPFILLGIIITYFVGKYLAEIDEIRGQL